MPTKALVPTKRRRGTLHADIMTAKSDLDKMRVSSEFKPSERLELIKVCEDRLNRLLDSL